MRIIGLAVLLLAFWLLLSGHYTAWLIGAGILTAIAAALFAARAGTVDDEGFPVERVPAGLLYWPWLIVEVGKSALAVARIVLDPRLPIAPRLVKVPITQLTAVGAATYANSITLTPGTITVEIDRRRHELTVHALTAEGARGLEEGGMARRVDAFEGRG